MLHLFIGYTIGTWIGHAYFLSKYPEARGRVPDPLGWDILGSLGTPQGLPLSIERSPETHGRLEGTPQIPQKK
jgi:hypothetical protein